MKIIPAVLGMTGVILGAFGAHKLGELLAAAGKTHVWDTAVQYQLIHAVALLALSVALHTPALCENEKRIRWLKRASWAWIAGVILFSGSLYWVALGGPRWLWPFAPAGGLALIAGWACVAVAACARPANRDKASQE